MGMCNSKNKCKIKQIEKNRRKIEQRGWGTIRVVNRKKYIYINNYFKCFWTKHSNWKQKLLVWVKNNNNILILRESS